jgi:peptidoglycan biosynthesis protein MviN/MurJ (putative lipid II flippase)
MAKSKMSVQRSWTNRMRWIPMGIMIATGTASFFFDVQIDVTESGVPDALSAAIAFSAISAGWVSASISYMANSKSWIMKGLLSEGAYKKEIADYLRSVLIMAVAVVVISVTILIGIASGPYASALWLGVLSGCVAYLWRLMETMLLVFGLSANSSTSDASQGVDVFKSQRERTVT